MSSAVWGNITFRKANRSGRVKKKVLTTENTEDTERAKAKRKYKRRFGVFGVFGG